MPPRGRIPLREQMLQHRAVMLAAFGVSVLFLVSYVVYHANAGSRPFPGCGAIRGVYFTVLITHIILAALIVPMALVTLARGSAPVVAESAVAVRG